MNLSPSISTLLKNDMPVQHSFSLHFWLFYLLLNSSDGLEMTWSVPCFLCELLVALKRSFSLAQVVTDIISLSGMHATIFSIDQQLHWWCFVICLPWALLPRHWCRRRLSCRRVPAIVPKFGSQPGLDVISFQFIQGFDQNCIVVAEHRYLQALSDISVALFHCVISVATV